VLPGQPAERFGASVLILRDDVVRTVGTDAGPDAVIDGSCPR
jgi:hypothetical protein